MPSLKTQQKQGLKGDGKSKQQMPKDLGVWPGTLVTPSLSNLRQQFKGRIFSYQTFKDVVLLSWTWVQSRVSELWLANIVYKYRIYPQPRKNRPILATRTIPGVAKELHNALFTAYANGSKSTISKIAGETLAESLSTRLSNRAKGEKVLWSIMQYVSKPRLMSHRATELPFKLEGERAGVRQAVVRIHTQQSLRIGRAPQGKKKGSLEEPENSQKEEPFWGYGDNDANIEWGAERTKDVIEYVVLQRRLIKGKEEDWCLLGFVEPTTIADIRQWRAMAAGALAQEKAKKIKDKTRDAVPANAAPAA